MASVPNPPPELPSQGPSVRADKASTPGLALPELAADGIPRRQVPSGTGRRWRRHLLLAGLAALLLWLGNLQQDHRPDYQYAWHDSELLAHMMSQQGPASVTPDGGMQFGPHDKNTLWTTRDSLTTFDLTARLTLAPRGASFGELILVFSEDALILIPEVESGYILPGGGNTVTLTMNSQSGGTDLHIVQKIENKYLKLPDWALGYRPTVQIRVVRSADDLRIQVNEEPWLTLKQPATPAHLACIARAKSTLLISQLQLRCNVAP
jgi:hypothetical protein